MEGLESFLCVNNGPGHAPLSIIDRVIGIYFANINMLVATDQVDKHHHIHRNQEQGSFPVLGLGCNAIHFRAISI